MFVSRLYLPLRALRSVWVLSVAAMVATSLWPHARAQPPGLPGPRLARLDQSLALADGFLAGLYDQAGHHAAVTSEYYALPVRVRFPGLGWVEPGTDHVRVVSLSQGPLNEREMVRVDYDGSYYQVFVDTQWGPDGLGRGRIGRPGELGSSVSPCRATVTLPTVDSHRSCAGNLHSTALPGIISVYGEGWLPAGQTVTVQVAGWTVGTFGGQRQPRRIIHFNPRAQRHRFASFRYTLRHASEDTRELYRYLGVTSRAASLGRELTRVGFRLDEDLYAPLWGRGTRFGDGMPYWPAIYRDCAAVQPWLGTHYPYRSKICRFPGSAYVFASSYDTLAQSLQALHVLQRHHDPSYGYSDPDHLHLTPATVAHDLERKWKSFGEPECLVSCDSGSASTIRTAAFGALEEELGYRYGDPTSRRFADAAASVLERVQVPASGWLQVFGHRYYRPVQTGAFYSVWDRHFHNDQRFAWPIGTLKAHVVDPLNMRPEYLGIISSNAESTAAAVAFLIRYRCLRYGVGCARAPGQPGVS